MLPIKCFDRSKPPNYNNTRTRCAFGPNEMLNRNWLKYNSMKGITPSPRGKNVEKWMEKKKKKK